MSYKDKVLKKRLFKQSLFILQDFACSEPKLSLNNRRSIVAAISLGGSLANPYKHFKILPYYHINYQYTRQGLIRACMDKMITHPEGGEKVKKAICAISSLSAWAKTNPNLAQDIFDDFVQGIVPEDFSMEAVEPSTKAIGGLKKNFGETVALDLVSLSGNLFYKKYKSR